MKKAFDTVQLVTGYRNSKPFTNNTDFLEEDVEVETVVEEMTLVPSKIRSETLTVAMQISAESSAMFAGGKYEEYKIKELKARLAEEVVKNVTVHYDEATKYYVAQLVVEDLGSLKESK